MRVIYRQFAELCEGMINEDSVALQNPVISHNRLATALVKKLHDMRWLPHSAKLTPYTPDHYFSRAYPGLLQRIAAALLSKADEIKNTTNHDVASQIEDLRNKFPKSWGSEGDVK